MPSKYYLTHDLDLLRGCVDDLGGNRYDHLSQNVPDEFVIDLQADLRALEFDAGVPDGAFGQDTKRAVKEFQSAAGVSVSGIVDAETRRALISWIDGEHTRTSPPNDAAEPAPQDGFTFITPRVPHFSQGDPQWAGKILGRNHTIQKKGCAITCVAMVLAFRKRHVDPLILDKHLDQNGGYSGDSVVWSVAGACGGESLPYRRLEGSEAELAAKIHERLERNQPTLVRVDYGTDADLRYNHFVLAVGRTQAGDIVMNDPSTRTGDGYDTPAPENVIQTTSRKSGYRIVKLDWYD